jgi:hypothetical protein
MRRRPCRESRRAHDGPKIADSATPYALAFWPLYSGVGNDPRKNPPPLSPALDVTDHEFSLPRNRKLHDHLSAVGWQYDIEISRYCPRFIVNFRDYPMSKSRLCEPFISVITMTLYSWYLAIFHIDICYAIEAISLFRAPRSVDGWRASRVPKRAGSFPPLTWPNAQLVCGGELRGADPAARERAGVHGAGNGAGR